MHWLVSIPKDASLGSETVEHLREKLSEGEKLNEIKLPNVNIGTLDKLMQLGDALIKHDDNCEKVIHNICKSMRILDETISTIPIVYPIQSFLDIFHPSNSTSTNHIEQIVNHTNEMISTWNKILKDSFCQFSQLKQNIQQISTTDLKTCALCKYLNQQHITETDYLSTAIVVVPKTLQKEWIQSCYQLVNSIVPNSCEEITQDEHSLLYTIVLFKKDLLLFKKECNKHQYLVRELNVNQESEDDEAIQSFTQFQNQLAQNYKAALSDCYSAWIHIKMIRLLVESILHFGPSSLTNNQSSYCPLLIRMENDSQLFNLISSEFNDCVDWKPLVVINIPNIS